MALTSTEAIGVARGSCTFSPTVATGFSTGTRKVISWSLPPWVAPGAVTVTCAPAGAARATSAASTAASSRGGEPQHPAHPHASQ